MKEVHDCVCHPKSEEEMYSLLNDVLDKYERKESNLIQILHMAQAIFGYLPEEVLKHIATEMDLPMSKIYGVVTFYSLFSTQPKGRHTIQVCMGTACYVKGADKVLEEILNKLDVKLGETTKDGRFSVQVMRCIGACGLAPAISIDGEILKHVTVDMVDGILQKYE